MVDLAGAWLQSRPQEEPGRHSHDEAWLIFEDNAARHSPLDKAMGESLQFSPASAAAAAWTQR